MTELLDAAPTGTGGLLAGRYRLIERVGSGGMGRVYRARDEILERDVAVKLFHTDGDGGADAMRKVGEAKTLASLNHPSLVTLFDAHIDQGDHSYLVMEFVEGATLRSRLDNGPVRLAEAVDIARDLAIALEVVHAAGIVHRDVKPSNVLLRADAARRSGFHCVLADFGVAQLMDATRLTSPGVVIGTAAYLAPEQVRGEASVPASDVYALGLLLIEALTGQHPFSTDSVHASLVERLSRDPVIPQGIGDEWRGLLRTMTRRDPAERPAASEIVRRVGDLATTGTPVVPPAADLAPDVPASTRRDIAAVPTQPIPLLAAPPVPATTGPQSTRRMPLVRRDRGPLVLAASVIAVLAGVAALMFALSLSAAPAIGPVDREVGPATTTPAPAPAQVLPEEPAETDPVVPATETEPVEQPAPEPAVQPADNPNNGPGNNSGKGKDDAKPDGPKAKDDPEADGPKGKDDPKADGPKGKDDPKGKGKP